MLRKRVKRFASVRYDGALGTSERDTAERTLASAGAAVTSWAAAAGRTYACVACVDPAALQTEPPPNARVDAPPLVVLRVLPRGPHMRDGLFACLSGNGRPAGILDVRLDGDALIVELDASLTPLALVLATIDVELTHAPGRRIEPLLPLDDAVMTAFAGGLLGEPRIDATRLIETHLEPLLGANP